MPPIGDQFEAFLDVFISFDLPLKGNIFRKRKKKLMGAPRIERGTFRIRPLE